MLDRSRNPGLSHAIAFGLGILVAAGWSVQAATGESAETADRTMVTGIGGVFFKSDDPEALRAWYRDHLGIEASSLGADFLWRERADPSREGRTVWNVFSRDTEHFGPGDQQFMVNYRVRDLDVLLENLKASGIEPVRGPEAYDHGRFAWIVDGEGNRAELWEPPEK